MSVVRTASRLLCAVALLPVVSACGNVVRQGRSPVLLVVDSLQGAPTGGAGTGTYGSPLFSDVIVNVTSPAPCAPESPCPTVYSDSGKAVLHLESKDVTITPSASNQVTITRVHVAYRRADGRNTEGVDVPYAFDQGVTITVPPNGGQAVTFEIVRHVAKEEAPLVQLRQNPAVVNAVADVTFYGTDLVGNDIMASGSLSVEFGNFGDQ